MKNKWIMIGLLTCFLCGCGSNSETYMELADRYFATGQYDYAAYNYVRVLENDRENEEVYAKLIDAYIAQEKFEKAMNYLEEAEVMFGKEKMEDKRVLVESLLADVTPKPTVTPTLTPKATATPRPTATPKPTVTPTQAPTPTERPKPKASVTPIQAPTATEAPKETETPKSMETGKVTEQPTATPKPTSVPKPTATPKPAATPRPTPITMPDATAESCFEWKEYSDGTVGVAKYIGKNIKEVVVPKEASGKKVTRIGYDAFENSDIERIILPETIEVIGAGAFQECKKLSEAVLSDGLKTIGVDAFRGCISMKEFIIPESVEEVYIGAFDNCFSLKELHIPKDVNSFYFVYDAEYTEDTPIYGCDALASLTVAKENPYYFAENGILYRSWAENEALAFHVLDNVKGVVNLSERATGIVLDMLEGKDEIKQIVLADSVDYIDCTYGAYSDYVDRLKIDAANPYYSLKDGVLYSKKDNTLLALSKDAAGSYYEVPAGTKTISRGAFVNCTELETIKLPASFEYDQFTNYANVFRGNVKELQLAEGNSSFKITNDALLTADGVELLYVPSGLEIKNYRVPEGVRNIYDGAFRNNSTLESVTIPESVRWIETYAFSGCDNLTTIYAKKDSYAEGWALKHEYQVKEL